MARASGSTAKTGPARGRPEGGDPGGTEARRPRVATTSKAGRAARAVPAPGGAAAVRARVSPALGLVLVFVSVLLAQGLSIYTYQHVRIGAGFYPVTFAARLLAVAVVGFGVLRLSPGELGLGWPRLSRAGWGWVAAAAVVFPLAVLPWLGIDSYQAAYAARRSQTPELAAALGSFVAFTVSTTLPWELLHRSFLLHATRILLERAGLAAVVAGTVAILVTQSFEVLFHLVKPPLEALAMAIASPALSWLAFRTRSVWVPVLLHLEVEVVFFFTVLR